MGVLSDAGLQAQYYTELATARSSRLSDDQRVEFGKRWLGVAEGEVKRQLCYEASPASLHVERLRDDMEEAAEAAREEDEERALRDQVGKLQKRLPDMDVSASKLRTTMASLARSRFALVQRLWAVPVAPVAPVASAAASTAAADPVVAAGAAATATAASATAAAAAVAAVAAARPLGGPGSTRTKTPPPTPLPRG